MTDDALTLRVRVPTDEPPALEDADDFGGDGLKTEAPGHVLDEVDEDLSPDEEDDFELDLSSEAPLMTDSLQLFLNEAGRYPLLTASEEVELAKRIERGDLVAKERMIKSNLRLVVSIARRHQTQGSRLAT